MHWEPDDPKFQNRDREHLLDLLRTGILSSVLKNPSPSSVDGPNENRGWFMSKRLEKIKDMIEYIGKVLENFRCKQTEDWPCFRNIAELKAAGIRLKPNNTGSATDITFDLGTLKIHSIKVDDTTASMFLNLVAYEMTPNCSYDFGVSSYIAFLDALIDQAQDVKELRDKKILCNFLGSDEEVAKLFNEISSNVVPNPRRYWDVGQKIQKRYNNIWMTWVAQLYHQHFQNPWSAMAFLAAIVILALTFIQTVYTILGYHK